MSRDFGIYNIIFNLKHYCSLYVIIIIFLKKKKPWLENIHGFLNIETYYAVNTLSDRVKTLNLN